MIMQRSVLSAIGLVLAAVLCAQRPAHFEHRNADLVHALELFDKAKYGAAQTELECVTARISDPHLNVMKTWHPTSVPRRPAERIET